MNASSSPNVLGLDIGGANLKFANNRGEARSVPFPLWKQPDRLSEALAAELAQFSSSDLLAVTMTGELCDCFATRREGVLHILAAVSKVANRPIQVWQTDGQFAEIEQSRSHPLLAAASNWLALATFAARFVPKGPALLLDIGSTTSDAIPILDGEPIPTGRTDRARIESGELLYAGVQRTPLMTFLGCRAAAEVFATTRDVYLLLGEIESDPRDLDTADGRPATRPCAHARLARMFCDDIEQFGEAEALTWAERLRDQQIQWVVRSANQAMRGVPPAAMVLSGSGEFLGRAVASACGVSEAATTSLSRILGVGVTTAACAYAAAVLAAERLTA